MTSLESEVLNSTNVYREIYAARPLRWNDTLATFAEDHARNCVFEHSGGPYGENLAGSYPSPTLAIDAWAAEEPRYNYKKQKFTEENGHFTQLVWQNTTDVGCANVACEGDLQGDFLVCEYWPRGNVEGQFGDNVRKAGMGENGEPGIGSTAGERWRVPKWWGWVGLGMGLLWWGA